MVEVLVPRAQLFPGIFLAAGTARTVCLFGFRLFLLLPWQGQAQVPPSVAFGPVYGAVEDGGDFPRPEGASILFTDLAR